MSDVGVRSTRCQAQWQHATPTGVPSRRAHFRSERPREGRNDDRRDWRGDQPHGDVGESSRPASGFAPCSAATGALARARGLPPRRATQLIRTLRRARDRATHQRTPRATGCEHSEASGVTQHGMGQRSTHTRAHPGAQPDASPRRLPMHSHHARWHALYRDGKARGAPRRRVAPQRRTARPTRNALFLASQQGNSEAGTGSPRRRPTPRQTDSRDASRPRVTRGCWAPHHPRPRGQPARRGAAAAGEYGSGHSSPTARNGPHRS